MLHYGTAPPDATCRSRPYAIIYRIVPDVLIYIYKMQDKVRHCAAPCGTAMHHAAVHQL